MSVVKTTPWYEMKRHTRLFRISFFKRFQSWPLPTRIGVTNLTDLQRSVMRVGVIIACVASVSVGLSARWRRFSLFGCAKIGASATMMKAAERGREGEKRKQC